MGVFEIDVAQVRQAHCQSTKQAQAVIVSGAGGSSGAVLWYWNQNGRETQAVDERECLGG